MSGRAFAAVMGVMAVVGLLAFGLLSKGTSELVVGESVPALDLPKLDATGDGSLDEYKGRFVLINFWASWCDPCRAESPALQSFATAHKDKLVVVGVDTRDLSGDAQDFLDEFSITYPQLRDGDGEAARDYGTTGVPESFLIDPEGKLIDGFPGPFANRKSVEDFVLPRIGAE